MIDEQDAINIAKQVAEENGWPWEGPISAKYIEPKERSFVWFFRLPPAHTVPVWVVRTNAKSIGCNVNVVIAANSGEAVSKGFAPR
ncbi:MAG: hypothetical protein AAGD11_00945 [Planctomycetota bacterium]